MREQFINNKIIGIIYKNLVTKLNLDLGVEEKTKLTKKMIKVMTEVFNNIDQSRVNASNYKNILRQFINNCFSIIYSDLNKDKKQETFQQDSRLDRDRSLMGDRKNIVDSRSMDSRQAYDKGSNFASFNESFNIPQKAGFQGRYEPQTDNGGKKKDFAETLDNRYKQLQNEYGNSHMTKRPSTPPELRGDGGSNLNKTARENAKNKQDSRMPQQNQQRQPHNMDAKDFLKPQDARALPTNVNSKQMDTFNFGTKDDGKNYENLNENESNYQGNFDVNTWTTGINPNKFNIDENTPLAKKLAMYQQDRENMENGDRKQVRFEDRNEREKENEREQQREMEEQQRINRMREIERERKKMEADRSMDIKREAVRVPQNEGFSNVVEAKLGEYENTIELLLDKIKDLQKQQIKYMSGGNSDADDKIRLLQSKRDEILGEVTRLQSMTLDLEKQQQIIQEREIKFKQKELDLEAKMRRMVDLRNMDERQVMIKANSGRFTYQLQDTLTNVSAIQLVNYNIPYEEHNINSNNNKLYFSVVSENDQNVNNESDDDVLTSESENYIDEVYINANKVYVMTIPENNYDIYGLLEVMNKIGTKWQINFSLVKGKVVIKTGKQNRLKLYNDREYQNNLLPMLGFNRIIGDKYRHIAEKKYNIKNDKLVQLFIKNVVNEPFAEFLIGSAKIHKFTKEVNIENISRLDIEIKLNEKTFMPQEPYVLEFNIVMNNAVNSLVVESKNSSNPAIIIDEKKDDKKEENEEINTDDNDLLNKVSNLMNL